MTNVLTLGAPLGNGWHSKTDLLVERCAAIARPLIKSALETQREILSSAEFGTTKQKRPEPYAAFDFLAGLEEILWGEIFYCNYEYYYLRIGHNYPDHGEDPDDPYMLQLHAISSSWDFELLDDFRAIISDVFSATLDVVIFSDGEFDKIKAEAQHGFDVPSERETAGARILCDGKIRALAIAIKQAGGLLQIDLAKQIKGASPDEALDVAKRLEAAGFISGETVVLCKSTSRQVLRVPDLGAVSAMIAGGVCCACGRSIAQERHETAVSLTPFGSSLLDKSRWLSVLVYEELVKAGVPAERILIEATLGGDEVDCIAEIRGELVLFELKDKEFNLREAYSFGAKISIIKPKRAVIVTTACVGGDAREHFRRFLAGKPAPRPRNVYREERQLDDIEYIETVENVRSGIRDLVSQIARADAVELLNQALRWSTPDAASLVALVESAPEDPSADPGSREVQIGS